MISSFPVHRAVPAAGLLILMLLPGAPAFAETLEVPPDAHWVWRWGADALLYAHIGGGAIGLLSGTIAILSPKGRPVHRAAGRVFFYAMFVSFLVGAGVAPFLETGQRVNTVAGLLSLYLLVTSWRAARIDKRRTGWAEITSMAGALLVLGAGLVFMAMGASDPSGTVDGSPPQAFILFAAVGLFGAYGDWRMIRRGVIEGVPRIIRHLWRMCAALFIASASFFFGQQQALPEAMIGTLWQSGPVLFPLAALILWSVLARFPRRAG